MKRRFLWVLLIAVVIYVVYLLRHGETTSYEHQGMILVHRVEAFRQRTGRLPDNYLELKIEEPMNKGPYYERIDSANYMIRFNLGFDSYKVYHSSLGSGGFRVVAGFGAPAAGIGSIPGAGIGAGIGGFVGGIAGYFVGREVTTTIYDAAITTKGYTINK
jgi:hypothetical protein